MQMFNIIVPASCFNDFTR